MTRLRLTLALTTLTLVAAGCSIGEAARGPLHQETYSWDGDVPAGGWLRVRDINGSVRVSPSADGLVHLTAAKRWHRGSAGDARIETPLEGDSRYICALWGDASRCGAHTTNDGKSMGGLFGGRSDMAVDMGIAIPRDVKLQVETVNGSLIIGGATGAIHASTVNGDIALGAHGRELHASTVNGGISARLDDVAPDASIHFETVNGNVTLELPPAANADVDMSTAVGSLQNTLRFTSASPSDNPKELHGVLGSGGGSIHLETVHGKVSLQPLSNGASVAASAASAGDAAAAAAVLDGQFSAVTRDSLRAAVQAIQTHAREIARQARAQADARVMENQRRRAADPPQPE